MQFCDSSLTTDLGNLFLGFAVGDCRQSAISWHVCTGQARNVSQFESLSVLCFESCLCWSQMDPLDKLLWLLWAGWNCNAGLASQSISCIWDLIFFIFRETSANSGYFWGFYCKDQHHKAGTESSKHIVVIFPTLFTWYPVTESLSHSAFE